MASALTGETLFDSNGKQIGKITDVITNPATRESEWMAVKIGPLGGAHLVPVKAIDPRQEGVVVTLDKDTVKHSPRIKQHSTLTDEQREALRTHYGMPSPSSA